MNVIGAQQRRTEKEAKRKPGRGAAPKRRSSGGAARSGRLGGGRLTGESSARQRCERRGIDGIAI